MLTKYLLKNVKKFIDWAKTEFYNEPKKLKDILFSKEMNLNEEIIKLSFSIMIQRWARPAIELFLVTPRTKEKRLEVLKKYEYEVTILNNYIGFGGTKSRGLVSFVANGKHGGFQVNSKNAERPVNTSDSHMKKINSLIKQKSQTVLPKGDNEGTTKSMKPLEASKSGNIKLKKDVSKTEILDSANVASASNIELSILDKLEFSPPSVTNEQIQREIESDVDEFIACE